MHPIRPHERKAYYRTELDLGATKANMQVAGFLFSAAKNGNVTAQIFWLKTPPARSLRSLQSCPNAST